MVMFFFFSKSKLLNCTFYVDEIQSVFNNVCVSNAFFLFFDLRSFIPFVRSHRAQQNLVEQR